MTRRILTAEARDHILKTYATQGADEARALAPGYGIKPSYVIRLAKVHSVKVKFKYPRKKPQRGPDPRWQWARARGSVVA